MPLIEICKQAEGKQARASIEVRKFEQTGRGVLRFGLDWKS